MKKSLVILAAEEQTSYSSLIVGVKINGEVHDLQSSYDEGDDIQFIELDTKEGQNSCIYTVKQKDSLVHRFLNNYTK